MTDNKQTYICGLVVVAILLPLFLGGCSMHPHEDDQTPEAAFLENFREVMQQHVFPKRDMRAAVVGANIDPFWVSFAEAQGKLVNGSDYIILGRRAGDAGLGWDIPWVSPNDLFENPELRKTMAEECRIPFDTPVDLANGEAWVVYGECVLGLIDDCGRVFTHVDADGDWVTDCIDPRG